MRATVWEARDDWRWGKGVCVQGSVCTAGHTDLSACIATGFCGGLGFQGVCVCVCVCVCVSVDCWCPWGAEGKLNRACEPAIPHGQGLGKAGCVPPPILYLFSFAGFSVAPRG